MKLLQSVLPAIVMSAISMTSQSNDVTEMKTLVWKAMLLLCLMVILSMPMYFYGSGSLATMKECKIPSGRDSLVDIAIDKSTVQLNSRYPPPNEDTAGSYSKELKSYSEFQLLNDNLTYAYAGYYDDREKEAEVKIIALIPKEIPFNFTCTVHYRGQSDVRVTGYVKYHFASAVPRHVNRTYRGGFIICPVSNLYGPPKAVSLGKDGATMSTTDITVWPVPKVANKLTRCISPVMNNYSDVSQLISTIEFHRMFGVDKFVIYLESLSQAVADLLLSYASDGIVEMRNFTISKPGQRMAKYMLKDRYWGEWLSYQDCFLSQMYSAKYVMFGDLDEIVVPRTHRSIWEMADDLFNQTDHGPKPAGSLIFRNVYYPTFKNKTSIVYPNKDLAFQYNIYPLLYTTRTQTNAPGVVSKAIVRPLTVDLMWIHYVERFKKGWQNGRVSEDIATNQHYRVTYKGHMHPPETQDYYMLLFSQEIVSAVKKRYDQVFLHNQDSKEK